MINATPASIINGYFNGHSHFWGSIQPPDAGGTELEESIYGINLHFLNDGSPTRAIRMTGNLVSPDLSISGRPWTTQTFWKTAEPIGDSEHLPIQRDIHHSRCYQPSLQTNMAKEWSWTNF